MDKKYCLYCNHSGRLYLPFIQNNDDYYFEPIVKYIYCHKLKKPTPAWSKKCKHFQLEELPF